MSAPAGLKADLEAAAREDLAQAAGFDWDKLAPLIPYGDTYEGFTPLGREVCFERSYLWDSEPGGDIRVEVAVYEPRAYEDGVRVIQSIRRETV